MKLKSASQVKNRNNSIPVKNNGFEDQLIPDRPQCTRSFNDIIKINETEEVTQTMIDAVEIQ